jgi:1-hydroxycarotenoid 3,4-desaturase
MSDTAARSRVGDGGADRRARLAPGQCDVAVVGAGFGGLTAAIELAAAGLRVQVFEAGPRPGGKADVVRLDEGVEVDTGPSVLTMPDVFDAVFRRAGTSLAAEVELLSPSPAFRYVYPDGEQLPVYVELAETLAAVARVLGVQAREELERFLARSRRVWEAAEPHFVRGPAPSVSSLLGLSSVRALTRIDAHRTLYSTICADVSDERLRWLLARYATYNGSDPRRCPATLGCIAWVELGLGAYGVRGGMHALASALARVARRLGVQLHFGAPVARIVTKGRSVTGLQLADGAQIATSRVVCNADVAHLATDLLDAPPRGLAKRAQPSMSGWVGIARVPRREAEALAAHTVVFAREYLAEFADIFDRDRPPGDPTVYLCQPEHAFGRSGWRDHVPVFAMANAPPEPVDGPRPAAAWRELRAAVERRLVDSGVLSGDLDWVWERSPAALEARFPRSRGAIYGASSNEALAAFRRPANRVRELAGLYLASGSAHPGGGVPLCALSGKAAAVAALADAGVQGVA